MSNYNTCGIIRSIDAASHFCVNISVNSAGNLIQNQKNSNNIQRTWCSDTLNGTLVGGNGKQAVVLTHYNCCYENCYCETIAQDFLNYEDDLISFKEDITKNFIFNNSSMFLVLVNGADIFTVDISLFGEMEWISYECGATYFLNENKLCSNTNGYIIHENNVINATNEWLCGANPFDVAPILTENLSLVFSEHKYSIGISLFQTRGELSIIPITNSIKRFPFIKVSKKNLRKIPSRKDSVKGFISAYNFYVQYCHEINAFPNTSNADEVIVLISQKWKSLSKLEKEPFEKSSLLDKQRYLKEIEDINTNNTDNETKLWPNLNTAKKIKKNKNEDDTIVDDKKKPRTAYNIFVNQEKQFIELFDSVLYQKVGLLAGIRWKNMCESEKNLYQLLANQEAQSFKQFI